jgi:hypothetical protein
VWNNKIKASKAFDTKLETEAFERLYAAAHARESLK